MKSRRNSRECRSTENLHRVKIQRSPNKSESNSNPRSHSNKRRQRVISKNKEKLSLDVGKPSIRQTINSNPEPAKSNRTKAQNHKSKDDTFVKKKTI